MNSRTRRIATGSLAALALLWGLLSSCATSNGPAIVPAADSGKPGMGGDGACGATDQPCCTPPMQCGPGDFCNPDDICRNQHPKDLGHNCSSPNQCSSGICGYTQGLGDGGALVPDGSPPPDCPSTGCTVGCYNTTPDCLPGWTCSVLTVGEGTCTCSCAPETCDGMDNNCDGVIDNEPASSDWCTAQMEGIPQKCVNGACTCVTTCSDECVDLKNDPNNCGKCNAACKPTVEKCSGGACVCAYTVCHGTDCVDTMASDNANCGGCDVTCDYECTLGVCGPIVVPTTDLDEIGAIVVDSTNVYWLGSLESTDDLVVEYCPLAGCTGGTASTLTTSLNFGEPSLDMLAVTASGVYFSDEESNIETAPLTPSMSTATIYSTAGDEESIVAADATRVYWVDESLLSVDDCAIGTSCASPLHLDPALASSSLTPIGIAVSGGTLYFGLSDETFTTGNFTVMSVPAGGGTVSTLCTAASIDLEETQMVIAGGNLYFTDEESTLYVCSLTAPGATATTYFVDTSEPFSIASDGTDLYWLDSTGSGESVMKCALGTTCATATTLTSDTGSPVALAVSATSVYWTSNSSSSFTPQVNFFHK